MCSQLAACCIGKSGDILLLDLFQQGIYAGMLCLLANVLVTWQCVLNSVTEHLSKVKRCRPVDFSLPASIDQLLCVKHETM